MCCVHKQKMYDKCTWNEPEHVVLEPFVFALSNIKYRERKNRGLVHDAIGKRITNFEKPILQWRKRMKNARFFDGDLHEKTVKRFNCFQKKKNHFTTSALNERRETLCDQRLFCIFTRVCVCVILCNSTGFRGESFAENDLRRFLSMMKIRFISASPEYRIPFSW